MGSDCAVGVETDGNFGVVCLDAGKIFCSTCVCVCVCACVCVCVCVCACTCSVYKKLCYGWVQWYLSFDGMEKCLVRFRHMCYLQPHAAVHVSFPNGKVCNNVQVHVVTSII